MIISKAHNSCLGTVSIQYYGNINMHCYFSNMYTAYTFIQFNQFLPVLFIYSISTDLYKDINKVVKLNFYYY